MPFNRPINISYDRVKLKKKKVLSKRKHLLLFFRKTTVDLHLVWLQKNWIPFTAVVYCHVRIRFCTRLYIHVVSYDMLRLLHQDCGTFTSHYYRPLTTLREGNVFTSVCPSFLSTGGDVHGEGYVHAWGPWLVKRGVHVERGHGW